VIVGCHKLIKIESKAMPECTTEFILILKIKKDLNGTNPCQRRTLSETQNGDEKQKLLR